MCGVQQWSIRGTTTDLTLLISWCGHGLCPHPMQTTHIGCGFAGRLCHWSCRIPSPHTVHCWWYCKVYALHAVPCSHQLQQSPFQVCTVISSCRLSWLGCIRRLSKAKAVSACFTVLHQLWNVPDPFSCRFVTPFASETAGLRKRKPRLHRTVSAQAASVTVTVTAVFVVRLLQLDRYGAFHSQCEVYAELNTNVFRWCLNVVVASMHGVQWHNARSPNRRFVRGIERGCRYWEHATTSVMTCRRPVWADRICNLLHDRLMSCEVDAALLDSLSDR